MVEIVAADVQFLGRRNGSRPTDAASDTTPESTTASADDVSPDEIPF